MTKNANLEAEKTVHLLIQSNQKELDVLNPNQISDLLKI